MLKEKKIAFVIPTLSSGGAERVLTVLANALSSTYDITIIIFHYGESFYKLNPNINVEYCNRLPIKTSNIIRRLINHYKLHKKIKLILQKQSTDLVIGFMTTANIHATLASRKLNLPSIISERVHPEFSNISKVWFKIRKLVYPNASQLVVQTEMVYNYFLDFIAADKLSIISNPIAPVIRDQKIQNANKHNIILSVGRLDNQKNHELLIHAFSNLNPENWQLNIIGDGVNMSRYKNLIRNFQMEDKIKLLGTINKVGKYYNQSKVFVLPSNFEGSPNALIEAMFFGLACISTDCPSGPRELISDGENGFLIPINDQHQLEERLQQLMSDESLRKSFGKKAEESLNHLQLDQVVQQWDNLILKTLRLL